jgi:hypothetical protein
MRGKAQDVGERNKKEGMSKEIEQGAQAREMPVFVFFLSELTLLANH